MNRKKESEELVRKKMEEKAALMNMFKQKSKALKLGN